MEILQNAFENNHEEAIDHFNAILNIGRKFMGSPIYKSANFIMLWKLITKVPKWFVSQEASDVDIVNLCVEYVRENIDEKEYTGKHKKFKESLTRFAKYIRFVRFSFC